jgi:hypothetical protein
MKQSPAANRIWRGRWDIGSRPADPRKTAGCRGPVRRCTWPGWPSRSDCCRSGANPAREHRSCVRKKAAAQRGRRNQCRHGTESCFHRNPRRRTQSWRAQTRRAARRWPWGLAQGSLVVWVGGGIAAGGSRKRAALQRKIRAAFKTGGCKSR